MGSIFLLPKTFEKNFSAILYGFKKGKFLMVNHWLNPDQYFPLLFPFLTKKKKKIFPVLTDLKKRSS